MKAIRRWLASFFAPAAVGPTGCAYEVTVAGRNEVTSPLTGDRGACIVIEVLERLRSDELRGEEGGVNPEELVRYHAVRSVHLGDSIVLACDDGVELTISTARVSFVFATVSPAVMPLVDPPLELGTLEENGRTRFFREQAVRVGDRFRIRATIEERSTVVGNGYRSGVGKERVVREDLGGVVLEELLAVPSW